MSHFTVTVALPAETDAGAISTVLAEALAPFDENREADPYISHSKADIALDARYQKFRDEHPECTPEDWYGGRVDAEGNILSTYNPNAQWDWWAIGGRWGGYWTVRDASTKALTEPSAFGMNADAADPARADVARVADIESEALNPTFAFIDLDGTWHEKGQMGWWGMTRDEKDDDEWATRYLKWFSELPRQTWLVCVDCHI